MRIRYLLLGLVAALSLAGCFTSEKSLIADDQAVAPYAKITFNEKGSPEDRSVLVRQGKAYVAHAENGSQITVRFMPVGDSLYLTEVTGDAGGKLVRLYALLKLDDANRVATTYKSVADKSDAGPGLPLCQSEDATDTVCIEDVNAYVALAKSAIDAGAEADETYDVKFE